MPVFTVEITGTEEEIAKLETLRTKLNDFSEVLPLIGAALIDYYHGQVFDSWGGVFAGVGGVQGMQGEGVPWAPLAPSTVAYKSKHFRQYDTTPLIATGTMRDSFYFTVDSPVSLEIGNTAPYFDYHQSDGERTKLPRRTMLAVNTEIKDTVKGFVELDVKKKIAGL